MSASIVQTLIDSEVDGQLVLSNSGAVRKPFVPVIGGPFTLPDFVWTTIRIGIRLAVDASASITTLKANLGLCSGFTAPQGSASPTHYVGARLGGIYTPEATLIAGPPAYLHSVYMRAQTTVAGTEAIGGAISTDSRYSAALASIRSCLFVEITKGAPNFTISAGYPTNTGAQTHITKTKFLQQFETALSAIGTWASPASYSKGADVAIAVDQTANGNFDHVNIEWAPGSAPLYISDAAYAIIA